jgi:hypothetical protein
MFAQVSSKILIFFQDLQLRNNYIYEYILVYVCSAGFEHSEPTSQDEFRTWTRTRTWTLTNSESIYLTDKVRSTHVTWDSVNLDQCQTPCSELNSQFQGVSRVGL